MKSSNANPLTLGFERHSETIPGILASPDWNSYLALATVRTSGQQAVDEELSTIYDVRFVRLVEE